MRALVLLGVAACGARATPTAAPPPCHPPTPSAPQLPANTCQLALAALADGNLDGWRGADGCTRADVDHVFGTAGRCELPGAFGAWQEHRPQRATPDDIEVYYQPGGDALVAIEIGQPRLVRPWRDVLGAPEATQPTRHFDYGTQYVYASRGLAVHETPDGDLIGVVGFRRMSLDAFQDSGLALAFEAIEEPPR